jgi:hypothetical protein
MNRLELEEAPALFQKLHASYDEGMKGLGYASIATTEK